MADRGDANGFAAKQVSNFRDVLIRMHDKHHVLFEDRVIVAGNIAGSYRSEPSPCPRRRM